MTSRSPASRAPLGDDGCVIPFTLAPSRKDGARSGSPTRQASESGVKQVRHVVKRGRQASPEQLEFDFSRLPPNRPPDAATVKCEHAEIAARYGEWEKKRRPRDKCDFISSLR